MTLPLRHYPAGMAGKGSDVEALARIASGADDAVLSVLAHVRGTLNRRGVLPLVPGELVVPSTTAGRVTVRPSRVLIGGNGTTPTNLAGEVVADGAIALSATQLAAVDVSITANTSGSDRYDLVFATVGSTDTTLVRGYKGVSDGAIGAHAFPVVTAPAMTVAVNAGGASAPAAGSDGMYGLTDPTGAYRVPLAIVRAPTGFDPATTLVLPAYITPAAPRAWIQPETLRGLRPANGPAIATSPTGITIAVSPVAPGAGFGARVRIATVVECSKGGTGAATLDSSMDWRHRIIRASVIFLGTTKPANHSSATTAGTTAAIESGPVFTGGGAGGYVWEGSTTDSPSRTFRVNVAAAGDVVHTPGNLTFGMTSDIGTSAPTEYYLVEVEASDVFDGR